VSTDERTPTHHFGSSPILGFFVASTVRRRGGTREPGLRPPHSPGLRSSPVVRSASTMRVGTRAVKMRAK
jgi:hypothetical protein